MPIPAPYYLSLTTVIFIDDVATRILELENNTLTSYTGNYEQYVNEKKNNAELLLRQFKIPTKRDCKARMVY